MHRLLLLSALVSAFLLSGAAQATPVDAINGETKIYLSAAVDLGTLGVSVIPGGTGDQFSNLGVPGPLVLYNVTAVDRASQEIFHEGSVLSLTVANTVMLSNFVIDLAQGFVFADVASPSTNALASPVLEITKSCSFADPCIGLDGTSTIDGLELSLTADAAQALVTDLGIRDLTGVSMGVSNSIYTLVPEPGTALLTMTGLLILGRVGRRRS